MRILRSSVVVAAAGLLWQMSCTAVTLSVDATSAKGATLPDAVIHVYPATGRAPLKPNPTAIIDQINKEFVPLVSVVQTGTSVRFPNKDNIRHQVYSFSPAKRFERRLYSGERSEPVVFDKPGLVVLGCNIHDGMVAYVMVVDTPWFAMSDATGHAQVTDLPAGEYKILVWHRGLADDAPTFQQAIQLTSDRRIMAVINVESVR